MKIHCPRCPEQTSQCPKIVRKGHFFRKSDSRYIRRYQCLSCGKHFSTATFSPAYRQKKRRINDPLKKLLVSRGSKRRAALLLGVNRKTITRKLKFLARLAELENGKDLEQNPPNAWVQFDDLETIEHSKCKPISVTMAVEYKTRRILWFEVAKMPAKGHLAKIARKKYGPRPDERPKAREALFKKLKPHLSEATRFDTDEHPHYGKDLKRHFPKADHRCFKGRRACVAGQGEMKQGGYDPLFWINHTFASCRDNINRLTRRTWATTKKIENLRDHLHIYAHYHNTVLLKNPT
jgi:transposase-like protein